MGLFFMLLLYSREQTELFMQSQLADGNIWGFQKGKSWYYVRSFVVETSHSYGHLPHVSQSLMQGAFPVPSRLGELEHPCAFRVRVE